MRDIGTALRHSWHMFAASVSTTLYLHTNTFVLGLMRGPEAVALYSLANRLVAAMQSLVSPVAQAVFPRASLLFAEQREQAWRLLKRIAWLLLPAVALASLLLAVFAPTAVNLLGGSSYSGVVPVLRIMAVVPVLVTIATLLAQIVMVNLGLTKPLFRIYLAVGLLNLVLLPLLILAFDAKGAAMSLVVAEALGPVLMGLVLRRHARVPKSN
jgi:O-antigen/teichoic acid export membrane protein